MAEVTYRELDLHEAQLLESIDRSESIDAIYRVTDGTLVLEQDRQEVVSCTQALCTIGLTSSPNTFRACRRS